VNVHLGEERTDDADVFVDERDGDEGEETGWWHHVRGKSGPEANDPSWERDMVGMRGYTLLIERQYGGYRMIQHVSLDNVGYDFGIPISGDVVLQVWMIKNPAFALRDSKDVKAALQLLLADMS